MALQLMPILRALAPIVANAGTAAASLAGMRNSAEKLKTEERFKALEDQLVRTAQVAAALAQQTQAVAQQVAAQEATITALERKVVVNRVIAIVAVCVAAAALIVTRL